ncbi:MAG: DUF4956 domain-containing protein [Bacilli bacterium]
MSFFDLIKKSVVEEFTGTISLDSLLISLLVACLTAIFIVYVYRKTYSGVVFSKSFALCILLITMVTTLVIKTINSNLALSLGMVGALSIVRYRTAVKDPIDTGFMFWGITAGIMSGAGLYLISIIASLALGFLFFLSYLFGFKASSQYLLVIRYNINYNEIVLDKLRKLPKHKLRSKSISNDKIELTFDIDIKEGKENIIEALYTVEGIDNVNLISYQNDFGA